MRQARTIPDTITVQQQLSGVTEQIEQLTGQQQVLDGQSSFATIAVGFRASGRAGGPARRPVVVRAGPRPTRSTSWSRSPAASSIVLGALVPFAVLAVLGLVVWGAVRRRRPHLGAGRRLTGIRASAVAAGRSEPVVTGSVP